MLCGKAKQTKLLPSIFLNNLKALIETIKEKSKEYETCENNVKSYISKINI